MKRKTLTLSLLALSCLTAAGCSQDESLALRPLVGTKMEVGDSYSIVVDAPEGVTVTVADSARSMTIVNVEVEAVAGITVHDVLANGLSVARRGAGGYYFRMPDEEVTITIDCTAEKLYSLSVNSPEVHLEQIGAKGVNPGDTVSFELALLPNSAYNLSPVLTIAEYDAESQTVVQDIDYTVNKNVYSFVAPENLAHDVVVGVELSKRLFSVSKAVSNNIGSIYVVADDGTETDITYTGFATAGDTIRVVLTNTTSKLGKGITIVETKEDILDEDGDMSVTFIMPSRNISLMPITADNLKNITFNLENAPHLTGKAYVLDEDTNELVQIENLQAVPYTVVYVDFESSDPNYKATSVSASYYYSSTSSTTSSTSVSFDSTYSMYKFTMPDCYQEVVVTPVESQKQIFNIVNSDHITLSTYYLVDGEYVATDGAFARETVYILPTIEGETVSLLAITVSAMRNGNSVNISTSTSGGYYYFTMDNTATDYTIKVTEDNPTRFAGFPFVGSFKGANIYGSYSYGLKTGSGSSGSKTFSIAESGAYSGYRSGTFVENTGTLEDGEGILTCTDGRSCAWGENMVITGYNVGSSLLSDDDLDFFVKVDSTSSTATFNYIFCPDAGSSTAHRLFVQGMVDGVVVANAYVDFTNMSSGGNVFYMKDVVFTATDGAETVDVSTETGSYDVSVGGVKIGSVSSRSFTPVADGE